MSIALVEGMMTLLIVAQALAMDPLAGLQSAYEYAYPKPDSYLDLSVLNRGPFAMVIDTGLLVGSGRVLPDLYGPLKRQRMKTWAEEDTAKEFRDGGDQRMLREIRGATDNVDGPEHQAYQRHYRRYAEGKDEVFNRSQRRGKMIGWGILIFSLTDGFMRLTALDDHRDPGYLATPLLKPIELGVRSGIEALFQEGE